VLAYLFCQQGDVWRALPPALGLATLAGCVSSAAWLWIAARALFNDAFRFSAPVVALAVGMVVLGLAAHARALPETAAAALSGVHAAAMLGFTGAALWEIAHGWADDLVEPRRVARRWVALGIGLYAALALVVELALRGRDVGRLLPAVHVAGIGCVTLALAVLVARRSLDEVLGIAAPTPAPPPVNREPAPAALESKPAKEAQALERLNRAMTDDKLYRLDGLTLAALAQSLGFGEAALRTLINHELGFRNFNDFLHHYRLQEAAARLANEGLPILTIALECGYGSIGPFNRAFRQRMGMTPSEYRGASRLPRVPAPD
jgi:AraC-like DNA-binding protein